MQLDRSQDVPHLYSETPPSTAARVATGPIQEELAWPFSGNGS